MKRLFYLTTLILSITFLSCDLREVHPPSYSEVVSVNMSQKDIYTKIMNWSTNYFIGSEQQIILNDKDNGIISVKGYIPNLAWNVYGKFILKIQIKDNKYRLHIVSCNAYTVSYGREMQIYYNRDALEVQNLYFKNLFMGIEYSVKNNKSEW